MIVFESDHFAIYIYFYFLLYLVMIGTKSMYSKSFLAFLYLKKFHETNNYGHINYVFDIRNNPYIKQNMCP